MRRLFFALPLSTEEKAIITKWRHDLLALGVFERALKPVPPENLHITLAFLGQIDEQTCELLCQQAANIQLPEFALKANHTGYFAKPKVAYLGMESVPEPLQMLADQLQEHAMQQAITMHHAQYTPHITLFRKAKTALANVVCDFEIMATRFALFESISSETGVIYRELHSWPLNKVSSEKE